jgi:hypothetical protein
VVRRSAGAPDAPDPSAWPRLDTRCFLPPAQPAIARLVGAVPAGVREEPSMKRYTAHLTFTLVALWVIVVFVLVSNSTN